jgi:hypothetical protein
MSRESNTLAHKGKTARDRKGMPAFHGGPGRPNRKADAKLMARQKDWGMTLASLDKGNSKAAPAGGWQTAYHRPGSYQ